MIERYLLTETIEPCPPGAAGDWLNLGDPDEAEIAAAAAEAGAPEWFLSDPLDPQERPRVDQEGEALFIVIRLQEQEALADGSRVHTVPVGLTLTPGRLITVCRRPGLVQAHLRRLFSRKRHWTPLRVVLALFHAAGYGFIKRLEDMEALVEASEARLRRSPENTELMALMNIERSLIDLNVALKSNQDILRKFQQPRPFGLDLTREELDLLDDAVTENQQAVFMAEIFGRVLGTMSEAFGNVISNNLNKVMKFLTGMTIVLMLPNLISGLYGMNVALPLAENPHAFAIIITLSLTLVLAVCLLFARKKWF